MSHFMATILAQETLHKSTKLIDNKNYVDTEYVDEKDIDREENDKSKNIKYPPCLSIFLK